MIQSVLRNFPKNNISIPVVVLEELDKMKRLPGELGKNARAVFRLLDSLPKIGKGNLHSGVHLENGAMVRIQIEMKMDYHNVSLAIKDNQIIMAAYLLHEKGEKVVFVSKDFAARIKAEALGLEVQDYENLKNDFKSIYKGIKRIETEKA